MDTESSSEYLTPEHALAYLAKADSFPHRSEGEAVLLKLLPESTSRILDLGTGDGRLLHIILLAIPKASGIGIDFSPTMIESARSRFEGDHRISIVDHDFNQLLPSFGQFDAIVSSFAIHHLEDKRKQELNSEIYSILRPGGAFCNLEHVSSPTAKLHEEFYRALGASTKKEDPSNRCAEVAKQLEWLEEAGFRNVDCFWKWREFALLAGRKD